jgi:hypothetical protein
MFLTNDVEKIRTHILCSINYSPENRAVYEIMWENIVEPARHPTEDSIIRRMRVAYLINKTIDTQSAYVILLAFARHHDYSKDGKSNCAAGWCV